MVFFEKEIEEEIKELKNEGIVDLCGRLYDNEGIVLVHVPATRKNIGSNTILTYDFLTACLL